MKKIKIQNITIAAVAIILVVAVIAYSYSADQTKQKGSQFGKELEQIQQDVAELQTRFYSEKTKHDEGDISKEELSEYYKKHVNRFEKIISRYDKLSIPESFVSAVALFKISSETQLASDIEYIRWISTGDESAKVRSDTQIQESYDYENLGLAVFQRAKAGVTAFDEAEKFSPPSDILGQKVIQISENMKDRCYREFKSESDPEWLDCINDAKEWKIKHLP